MEARLSPGRTVGHSVVAEKIGEGGMGVVYKGRDSHLGRLVALKVLAPDLTAGTQRDRLLREAQAVASLNHQGIATIYDIDSADGVEFIAMEFVAGRTLAELIPRGGLPVREALKLAVQIADALGAAHAAGIVHRDLKPGNVMVTPEGRVKVLDFGLAKFTARTPTSGDRTTALTSAGAVVGTAIYMSPEQARGQPVDQRSDVFSKEKPDEQTAQKLLRSGDHSWNSGMFIRKADSILREIQVQMPMLDRVLKEISSSWNDSRNNVIEDETWNALEVKTVDYGIMEKAERVAILPAGGLGWSDVGMWSSLFEVLLPDMNGNIATNSSLHLAHETHNTLVYGAGTGRLVVTIGVDNMVIVDTGDILLVCKTDQSQKVRDVVDHLKKHQQERFL